MTDISLKNIHCVMLSLGFSRNSKRIARLSRHREKGEPTIFFFYKIPTTKIHPEFLHPTTLVILYRTILYCEHAVVRLLFSTSNPFEYSSLPLFY